MKVRLYRGPFNGKVMDHPRTGDQVIQIRGPKPMTRKQRYEWEREEWTRRTSTHYLDPFNPRVPMVMANYRICVKRVAGAGLVLTHPDGSVFYEWDRQKPVEY